MEEAKSADNGAGSVKKKSFLKKILLSKWFYIIVLILGVSGYGTWWGMNWWQDFKAKEDGHDTHQVAQDTHSTGMVAAHVEAVHEGASHEQDTHGVQVTHQPVVSVIKNQDAHNTVVHEAEPENHTVSHSTLNKTTDTHKAAVQAHAAPAGDHGTAHAAPVRTGPRGVAFVQAAIKPLDNELNHRFLGWRPNDIIRIADNIKNLQLGILEVTRRTAVALAENLSRTGSTDAYVPSLEYAMNSFMIKPTELMFPSAEGKYQEALDGWKEYQDMLQSGEARFYRRVDNLVPLLKAYESILGSCDENLVKKPGELSTFKADDIFYYAKGVAIAMGTILEAALVDFDDTLGSQGMDVLHHTVQALHHASHMDPWIVLEGSPDGIFANHRANIAAPISHARFYLDVLSRTLTGNL